MKDLLPFFLGYLIAYLAAIQFGSIHPGVFVGMCGGTLVHYLYGRSRNERKVLNVLENWNKSLREKVSTER